MNVTIYGTESDSYIQVVHSINSLLKDAGIDYVFTENENLESFLNKKISSVPAVEIDGNEIYSLKKNDHFVADLRLLLIRLLRKNNFGKLFKIVLPTDFSEYSDTAFKYATAIARYNKGVIIATHVYTPNIVDINGIVHTSYASERACRAKLFEFVDNYRINSSVDISADPLVADDFLIGFPSAEISTLAKKLPADLIVMATKAPQSFLKRWLGSTAYEVIAKTLTPVLLIPPKATNKSIKYINIAIEHPKDLDYVLSSISWVKYIPEVVINLIHINENLNGLKKVFDQALEEYKDWNLRFNNIAHTNIVEALVNLAENDDNDLLVVYHKDKAWLDSLLHKSVSKQVLGQINAPLLIVS